LYQPLKKNKQKVCLQAKYISGSTYEYLLLYPFDRGYELVMGIQRDEGTVSSGAWFQWRSLEYRLYAIALLYRYWMCTTCIPGYICPPQPGYSCLSLSPTAMCFSQCIHSKCREDKKTSWLHSVLLCQVLPSIACTVCHLPSSGINRIN
jgi:hypothetical protein